MRRTVRLAALVALVPALSLVGCGVPPTQPGPTASAPPVVSPSPAVTPSPWASPSHSPAASAPAAAPSASPSVTASPVAPSPAASPSPSPTASASACPPSTGQAMRRAPGQGKTVALTIDDGPGPFTLQVLDALDAAGVKATFFMTGAHAAEHPDLVAEVARRGHLIGDHSYDHRYPRQLKGGWTRTYLTDQIQRTATVLSQDTGEPVCFFRPPGGFLDGVSTAARANRVAVVLWSIDTLDWKQPATTSEPATAAIVRAATRVGDNRHPVVILHDAKASHESDARVSPNRSNTVAALPQIIAWYRSNGFTFVRMDGRS